MTSGPSDALPPVCAAELLSGRPVLLSERTRETFLAKLGSVFGRIKVLQSEESALRLALEEHPLAREDGGSAPAVFMFLSSAAKECAADSLSSMQSLETSLSQTWDWAEAREVAMNSPHCLRVMDHAAGTVEAAKRISLFQRILHMLLLEAPCAALHFPESQRLVSPDDFLANVPETQSYYPLLGLVNVRLFTIQGSRYAMLMDTLGMRVFGLPDLQCYCRGLDPYNLSSWLYSVALYVTGNSAAIRDGDTIGGLDNANWSLRYEESLVPPDRPVIAVHAGEHDALGK
ncbi:DUF4261 domain-containing protein [Desulfovibrio sp. OttesenSCG-928-A18]|nr:DUF4261 domain-containing protein [Desulfovibrio sp. OttesenSCG-928-A18]